MKKMADELTPKQEAFIQAVASGMDNSEAYRAVYYPESMQDETISLANDPIVENDR
jgi:hypothetical protein